MTRGRSILEAGLDHWRWRVRDAGGLRSANPMLTSLVDQKAEQALRGARRQRHDRLEGGIGLLPDNGTEP